MGKKKDKVVFKRHEIKYLMPTSLSKEFIELVNIHMDIDDFGESSIQNIYFDTPSYMLIRRSLEKPKYKEKLRVRSYNKVSENDKVFVELKKKFRGVVYKRRIALEEKVAMSFLVDRVPLAQPSQISKEIEYLFKLYDELSPMCQINYYRQAFFSKEDKDFRITIDSNILCRTYDLDLKKESYGENVLPKNMVLVEIKTAMGYPQWLLNFLSENKLYKTSFSKYGTAYRNIILPKINKGASNIYVA